MNTKFVEIRHVFWKLSELEGVSGLRFHLDDGQPNDGQPVDATTRRLDNPSTRQPVDVTTRQHDNSFVSKFHLIDHHTKRCMGSKCSFLSVFAFWWLIFNQVKRFLMYSYVERRTQSALVFNCLQAEPDDVSGGFISVNPLLHSLQM